MKCLPLATLAMLAATTGAAGIADEFVQIPANPSFAFAKSLNPHSSDAERGKGKGSELIDTHSANSCPAKNDTLPPCEKSSSSICS